MKIKFHSFFLFIFVLIFGVRIVSAVDISACGTLEADGTTYNLIQDLSNPGGVCLHINSSNITLNGNYHHVDASDATLVLGSSTHNYALHNITIRDLYLHSDYNVALDTPGPYYNISFDGGLIENINIEGSSTDGDNGIGLLLVKNFTLNNITSNNPYDGNMFFSSSNITVFNSDFKNGNYGYGDGDISLVSNPDSIYFINTNLSGIFRRIYLSASVFNNTNNGINSVTSISLDDNTFDREVFSWTKDNLTWTDNNPTGGVSATYSLSNLNVSQNYAVYWNGVLDHNATTDGNGKLPSFSIALNSSINNIGVIAESVSSSTPTPAPAPTSTLTTTIERITGKIPLITNLIGVMIKPLLILSLVLFVLGMLEFLLSGLEGTLRFGR